MNAFKLNDDAIKFFKNGGLEKSREVIKMSSHALVDCGDGSYFHINQLKQIVDAFDCVMEHGSVEHAKKYAESDYTAPEVKEFLLKAINLVEQCQ